MAIKDGLKKNLSGANSEEVNKLKKISRNIGKITIIEDILNEIQPIIEINNIFNVL